MGQAIQRLNHEETDMMAEGRLIYHPDAGKGAEDRFSSLSAQMRSLGLNFTEIELGEESAADVAKGEVGRKPGWIAVAGGDGTVEAVAREMIGSGIPLGVIPMGTYNNFARSLNLPFDAEDAARLISTGETMGVDVGYVNDRPFFECVGTGLDAALFPLGEEIKSGKATRWIDLLRRAYLYPRHRFTLTLDRLPAEALVTANANESRRLIRRLSRKQKRTITMSALMITVSNGPYYGMNFAVAPEQRMNDGVLTVSVFNRYSKLQLWRHFASIAFGKRHYDPKSVAFRVKELELSGSPSPVHLDGHPEQLWPLKFRCESAALRVFQKRANAEVSPDDEANPDLSR